MKNPTRTLITRASLIGTAFHSSRCFITLLAGTTVLGTSISQAALNNVWVGGAPGNATNWNTPANWSLGHVPIKTGVETTTEHAVINIAAGPVLTLANGAPPSALLAVPTEIIIGTGSGTSGRLDHISGEASTGAGNHLYAGLAAGTGVFNLADTGTVVPSGNATGYGLGTGTMNVQNQFRIGDGANSNGTANINTTGTLTVASGIQIATNGATGRLNIDSGTVTGTAGWCEIGNGTGCNGRLDMTGGTLTKAGADGTSGFIIGANGATGEANISGNAAIRVTVGGGDGGAFRVGNAGGSKATLNLSGNASISVSNQFYVGNGTGAAPNGGVVNMTGGTISNTSWVAIGRSGGTGTVNMSGGTWTKTGGDSQFIIGANGPGSMTMSGGSLLDVQGGFIWVGEAGGATTASLTISGATTYPAGPEIRSPYISVGPESPSATLNLDGGTVKTHRFGGTRNENGGANSGNGTIKFNGSRIIATANDASFINDVNTVQVNAGGMLIDTAGFTLSTAQTIGGTGGGVTKLGAGSLTFSGTTSFNGSNTVNAGTLAFTGTNALPGTNTVNAGRLSVTTAATGTGTYVVADGATLGITQTGSAASLAANSTTLGTSTLDVNLGNLAGLPTAPALATGSLTLNGPVTVNITDTAPEVGSVPLVSYTGPKGGGGSFNVTPGSLPTGVVATVVDNGTNLVSLDVTRVNAPYWKGDGDGTWAPELDAVPADGDWFEDYSEVATNFQNGDPALFDDRVTGTTNVFLSGTVLPGGSGVRFDNGTTAYDLSGGGKISGDTTLTKTGSSNVTISTENDFTGATTIAGGSVSVSKLASSASPTAPLGKGNLVLAGGTLEYIGLDPQVTDQGFTIAGTGGGIYLAEDVEFQGAVTSTLGSLAKSGPGNLTFSFDGANVLGSAGQFFEVREGDLILTGGGAQTVSFPGGLYVATLSDVEANFTASDTAITVGGFFVAGRGNGNNGVSNVLLTDSTLTSGGFTTGYNNGNPANESEQFFTLDNSTITSTGASYLAENSGATATMTLSNNSQFNAGGVFILGRFGAASTANVTLNDTSKIMKTVGVGSHVAIGGEGAGTLTMNGTSLFSTVGGDFNVGDVGSAVGLLDINDDATVTSAGNVFIGKNSSKGTIDLSGTSNMSTTGYTNVSGGGVTSEGTLNVAGSAEYLSADRFLVGFGGGSKGFVTIDGSGKVQVNSYVSVGYNGAGTMTVKGDGSFTNNDDFSVNENGDAPVTVTVQDTGSLTVGGNLYVGRNAGKTGTLTVSGTGGEVNQTNPAAFFNVGQSGTGTLNILGSATVTAASNTGVILGQVGDGTGTVNLDGGTLVAKRIFGNAGASTFNFHGGLLRAATGASATFFSGVDNAYVKANGAAIDSNGQTISVDQPLLTDAVSTGGGLTKSGTGTLFLNGVNTYTGATTVTAGSLGGTGTIVSPITVQTGAALAPGAVTGTLTASQGVTFNSGSTFIVNIDNSQAADNGRLDTTGTLSVAGVHLQVNVVNGTATPYTIATAGTVTGEFASVTPGTTVSYNGNNITITPPASSPFQAWISAFDTNGLDEPGDDADADGLTNLEEFALDGDPSSGTASGKVRSRIETVSGQQALVITLPVRTGATFDNNPGPGQDATVAADDLVYLIKGSNNLADFDQGVSEIAESSDGMPELSDDTKWSYRTFRLNGDIPARGVRGFLTVDVEDATPAP